MPGWNEYDAALHCLQAPSMWDRLKPFVEERTFDWDGIATVYLSDGEAILVDAARTFWNGMPWDSNVLARALHTLDEPNTRRFAEAILIYERIDAVVNPMVTA